MKNLPKPERIVLLLLYGLIFLTFSPIVYADPVPPPDPNTIFYFPRPPEFKISSVGEFVGALGGIIFIAGLLVFFILLMLGGTQWLISGGDKAKLQDARGRIVHALVGLTILSMAAAIILLLEAFLGIKIIGNMLRFPQAFSS